MTAAQGSLPTCAGAFVLLPETQEKSTLAIEEGVMHVAHSTRSTGCTRDVDTLTLAIGALQECGMREPLREYAPYEHASDALRSAGGA